MLSQAELDGFVADGFVAVRGALPADVLRACQAEIWSELSGRGVRREDPSTWRDPVVRIDCPESEAFAAAGTQPVLWEAFDQLIGAGRWWRRRGVGGTIPVRFPSPDDPGDAGWHIEASFENNGDWWVNYRAGRPPWPPAGPETSSSATRSWSTPRRGRTRDGSPGPWPSPAWPCTTSSR
jgi:hypothetical protein